MDQKNDRRRGRTCNLLIRSQAPYHWASRPTLIWDRDLMFIELEKRGETYYVVFLCIQASLVM